MQSSACLSGRARVVPPPVFAALPSATFAPSRPVLESVPRAAGQRFYLFLPERRDPRAMPLVAIHGISRNAREQAQSFATIAAERGVPLIAPLFCRQFFPGYQRLGCAGGGHRADDALDVLLEDVETRFGVPTRRIALFGFSGGAQFAHRYAMLHPQRVAALGLGAAGWYTSLDETRSFPRGVGSGADDPCPDVDSFLGIPMLLAVGAADTLRDPRLRQEAWIDAEQGAHRLERAQRWAAAVNDAAARRGLVPPARCRTLPRAGHDFLQAADAGLTRLVVDFCARKARTHWFDRGSTT